MRDSASDNPTLAIQYAVGAEATSYTTAGVAVRGDDRFDPDAVLDGGGFAGVVDQVHAVERVVEDGDQGARG
jgi:hypothetical protein